MNNTFNIQRFGLLLRRQWLEFGKIYLVSLAVLLGIFIAFYGYNTYEYIFEYEKSGQLQDGHRVLNFRIPVFAITGIIFGTLVSSTYFSHLGQKPKAVIDLMIPASTFEKFLGGVLFTALLATVSYLVLFYLTDLLFVMKVRSFFEEVTKTAVTDENRMEFFFTENNPDDFKVLYFIPFGITSIFLFGSIYFNRFHYIKTAISVMLFSGLWTLIIVKAGQWLFDGRIPKEINESLFNGKNDVEWMMSLLIVTLTLIFWGLTYLRLKEKEV